MQKLKTFRPWAPGQTSLLPASPSDWLSADHQVYFLLDLVDELDLSAIVIPAQNKDPRGEKGFDPRMLTLLLLYAYCAGIVSSRRIERACYEDLAFRVLTGNQQPDHSRISEFRRRNLEALSGLFVQILRLCQEVGMVSLGHVALDGTKVQANASKHKAMSHERMLKAEAQLEKEIKELMRKAEILDAQEDASTARERWAVISPRSCSAARIAWRRSSRPAKRWRQKRRQPLPVIAPNRQQRQKMRLPMLTRRNKRMPASSTSCARRRIAHGRKQRPPEIWRSRRPVRQALSPRDWSPRQPMPCPIEGLPIGPMAAPRPVRSGISLIPTATS